MIELECPWCEEPVRVDFGALTESGAFSCAACRVEVELAGPDLSLPLARAA